MREILFRGMREHDGVWILGSLLVWSDGSHEICYPDPNDDNELLKFAVRPETVGQFTGLTDKNGKKIFEGDIVRSFDMFGREDAVGTVFWDELFVAWHMGSCKAMYGPNVATYEIIGNIYDNPN